MLHAPIKYVEDAFYRAVILEKDEVRRLQLWEMIEKIYYRQHPQMKELAKSLYGETKEKETGRRCTCNSHSW